MRFTRTAATAALASAVLATTLTGCQSETTGMVTGDILIAADLELSGAAAATGQALRRALELRVDQLNESGTLSGRHIRVEIRDNRSDPSQSLRNVTEFTENPDVSAIVMGACGECAIDAASTIANGGVPAISLAAAGAVASPVADRRYLFKLAPNARDNASALTGELRRRGVESVGILHTDDLYGREGLAAMTAELRKAEIELAGQQAVKPTASELNLQVTSLVDAEPTALVIWTTAEQATSAVAAARAAQFPGPVFFDAASAGELFFDGDAARTANNATMVFPQTMVIDDVIATTPAKAARKRWFRDYTARFGTYHGASSFAADAVQLIADAVRQGGGTREEIDRDGVRDALETSQLEGLSGPIRMTPANHSGLMPQALTVLVVRGGRWRLAG